MKKICNRCSVEKGTLDFYKDKRGLYGVRSICKKCQSIYNQKRYIDNYDIIIIKKKQYENSDRCRELSRIKRANRKALINKISDNTINYESTFSILDKQDFKCIYCKKNILNSSSRHLDHIIPISKGGLHSIHNVQWLCCSCNLKKHNKIGFIFKKI